MDIVTFKSVTFRVLLNVTYFKAFFYGKCLGPDLRSIT